MHTPLRRLPVILLGLATAPAGCSDNGGGGTADVGPDVQPDVAFVPNEGEPNDNLNPRDITLPTTIFGQINEPEVHPELGSVPDADFFRFRADAGTVVRLTLGQHTIEPDVIVETDEQGPGTAIRRRLTASTVGATRQLFIPVTGSYLVIVADVRNYVESGHIGGDSFTYELTISTETVEAESVSLPLIQTGESIPAGNGVRIFEMRVDSAGLLLADTDAFDTGTDLDTALLLMNDDLSELVAVNDDEDAGAGLYDAALRAEVDVGTYHLVVDHFETTGPDTTYDLSARVSDPAIEVEPTNGPDNAWRLPVAAEDGESFVVTGTIEAPESGDFGDLPDVDWFYLGEPATGDTIVITASTPEGSDARPHLEAGTSDPFYGDVFIRSLADADGVARLELTAIGVGGQPYYAIVGDARNLVPDDAPDDFVLEAVGGATYRYEITAQAFTRTEAELGSTPVSSAGQTLDTTGHVGWYTFRAAEGGLLLVAVENANLDPTVWLLERSAGDESGAVGSLTDVGDRFLVTEAAADTPLQLAVFNEGEWPIEATATFDLTAAIVEQEVGQESEVEGADFPDSPETALRVPAAGGAYEGELGGTNEGNADRDVFAVDLTAGARLVATTYGPLPDDGEGGANADTLLLLGGPGLDEPLENDDYGFEVFSRLEYDVPGDGAGTYTLTVMPYCDDSICDGGPYGIRVLVLGAGD